MGIRRLGWKGLGMLLGKMVGGWKNRGLLRMGSGKGVGGNFGEGGLCRG